MLLQRHHRELRRHALAARRLADHRAPVGHDRRSVHTDARIGQAWTFAVVVQHAVRVQPVVTVGVLRGVVDQHQMRFAGRFTRQRGEIEIGPDIPVHHQERVFPQRRQRVENAATGFQRGIAFVHEMQVQAPLAAIAQCGRELLGEPCGVDHHVADAQRSQPLQVPHDQWFAGHCQQRLGRVQGQWTHALAQAGGENQCLHRRDLQRSTRIGAPNSASAGLIRISSSCCNGASSR
ncbi:hypothetical protein D3C72_1346030 [compost metagenome]